MFRNKQRNIESFKNEKCFTPLFWRSSESIARVALNKVVALERHPKVRLRVGKNYYWSKSKRLNIARCYSGVNVQIPTVLLASKLPKGAGVKVLGKDYIIWATQSFRGKNA